MRKYIIDEETIWKETGQIEVYKTNDGDYFYYKIYEEIKKSKPFNSKYVTGNPIEAKDDAQRLLLALMYEAKEQFLWHIEEPLKNKLVKR